MANYITSIVETIRVPSVSAVEELHQQLKNDNRFTLKKVEYQNKEIKSKGEVIDDYELVKATLVFNDEKDPHCIVNFDLEVEEGFFPTIEEDY